MSDVTYFVNSENESSEKKYVSSFNKKGILFLFFRNFLYLLDSKVV
jgi:hypothetical protein